MLKFIISCICIAILCICNNANAWYHGTNLPIGDGVVFNLSAVDINVSTFINALNSTSQGVNAASLTDASSLDNDGYPIANFSNDIGNQFPYSGINSQTGPSITWIFSWPACRSSFKVFWLASANATAISGSPTITNGAGSGNLTIQGDGSHAGSVSINWVNGMQIMYYAAAYTNWANNISNCGSMSLVRQSDLSAYNAGTYWTQEYINVLKNLNIKSLRPMAINLPLGVGQSNESLWNYRRHTTSTAWGNTNNSYVPTAWSGGPKTAGTILVSAGELTASAATDTNSSGWSTGEVIQGIIPSSINALTVTGATNNGGNVQIHVASTTGLFANNPVMISGINGTTEAIGTWNILSVDSSTAFTIPVSFVNAYVSSGTVGYQTLAVTGKTSNPILILAKTGIGTDISAGIATFVYDSVLNAALYTGSGLSLPIPLEAQIQLSNALNVNYYWNIPNWATDNYITNGLNLIYNNLYSNLKLDLEYSNEMWNFGFSGTTWAWARGVALGISTWAGNPQGSLPYQGLAIRRIHGNLVSASLWGSSNRINRLYCFQGAIFNNTSGISVHMIGTYLVSPGSTAYQNFVGGSSVNYNTIPNRPIDVTDAICYAPYASGVSLSSQSPDINRVATAIDVPFLQAVIDNTNINNIAGATAMIDNNIRQGLVRVQTVTSATTTFGTPAAHNFVAGSSLAQFTVSGGTTYSGLNLKQEYYVDTTPTSTTFTIQPLINGIPSGIEVNSGSAGSGITSVGINGGIGIFNAANSWFPEWKGMASSFSRPSGAASLKVRWYEGALEPTCPSAATATSIGLTSPNGTAGTGTQAAAVCATAIINWLNDPMSAATIDDYYKQFIGTDLNSITANVMTNSDSPAQLGFYFGGSATNPYAILSNNDSTAPKPYLTYLGIQQFGNGN